LRKKDERAESPSAAARPYRLSAVAAPSPEARPLLNPPLRVRWMQRMPIGPTGAAMENPRTNPLTKREERKIWITIYREPVRGESLFFFVLSMFWLPFVQRTEIWGQAKVPAP